MRLGSNSLRVLFSAYLAIAIAVQSRAVDIASLREGNRLEVVVDQRRCRNGTVHLLNILKRAKSECFVSHVYSDDRWTDYRTGDVLKHQRLVLVEKDLAGIANYLAILRAHPIGRDSTTSTRYELALIRSGKVMETEVVLDNWSVDGAFAFKDWDTRLEVNRDRILEQWPETKGVFLPLSMIRYWSGKLENLN